MKNNDNLQEEILKKPYHELARFHYTTHHVLPDTNSFDISVRSLDPSLFSDDPLHIKDDLNWKDITRFLLFRFWVGYMRFPPLSKYLEERYLDIMPTLNLENKPIFDNAKALPIRKCLVWHLSRDLLEEDQMLFRRVVRDLEYSVAVRVDIYPRFLDVTKKTEPTLKSIIKTQIFQDAIKEFGQIFDKELNSENLKNIINKLEHIKITPICIAPALFYGMVLPDGFAVNLSNIKLLVEQKQPLIPEILLKRKPKFNSDDEESEEELEHPEITTYKQALRKFKEEFISVTLWVVIHLLGHFLVQTKEISLSTNKYKNADYDNLGEGFIFASIFLGCFAKKFGKNLG